MEETQAVSGGACVTPCTMDPDSHSRAHASIGDVPSLGSTDVTRPSSATQAKETVLSASRLSTAHPAAVVAPRATTTTGTVHLARRRRGRRDGVVAGACWMTAIRAVLSRWTSARSGPSVGGRSCLSRSRSTSSVTVGTPLRLAAGCHRALARRARSVPGGGGDRGATVSALFRSARRAPRPPLGS